MVEKAIAERIAKSRQSAETQGKTLTVDELLKNVSLQELRDFVVRQAKYNTSLTNAIKLEFAHKLIENENDDEDDNNFNPYFDIVRKILDDVSIDYDCEDYYDYEDCISLDELEQWFEKAKTYVEQQNYSEALLICKAFIEEFSEWMQGDNVDSDLLENIDTDYYQSVPFRILETFATCPGVDSKALYDYCLSEMNKDKYADTAVFDRFNDLLTILAAKINANEFIALQNNLLDKVIDKSSHSAERILQRQIIFYDKTQQPEKVNAIIENNTQIENFRYQAATKRFTEQNFAEARKLTEDFIRDTKNNYSNMRWYQLSLEIAQKENDIPNIRTLAFSFIEHSFNKQYFDIYKSAFTAGEWNDALENLLQHYEKNVSDRDFYNRPISKFNSTVAGVLIAEQAAERLMLYIEKHLTVERLEKYYAIFVDLYPEKTLELFRKTVDDYAAKSVNRSNYEYLVSLLEKIRKIKNGNKMVVDMVSIYQNEYKTRRVMMEILKSYYAKVY
ncbi:MAG: hypothetical protein LBE04_06470 [Prevotellaceae bacterium]|nr:hypothetical protein [Prevotellaceae bacterium]